MLSIPNTIVKVVAPRRLWAEDGSRWHLALAGHPTTTTTTPWGLAPSSGSKASIHF